MTELEKEAQGYIDMFLPHVEKWDWYNDIPLNINHDVQCAIKHVEGLIDELEQLVPTPDCNCDVSICDRITHLTQIKEILTNRLK